MLYEKGTIVKYPGIFLFDYIKMLLLVFLIILVAYLVPVYQEPRIVNNVLNEDECEYIKDKAKNKLANSTTGVEHTFDDNVRKSETAWLSNTDPVIRKIVERCIKYTDRPFENCENLQVIRYKEGGYYRPHHDIIKGEKNIRMYTFLIALNDEYEGGETEFPNLNKKYKLRKGDLLLFDTVDNYEFDTSKALHGGRPVKNGEKWVCNLWVRKYPYSN